MKRFFRSQADTADETAEEDELAGLPARGFGDAVPPPERPGRAASQIPEAEYEPAEGLVRFEGADDLDPHADLTDSGYGATGYENSDYNDSDYSDSDYNDNDYDVADYGEDGYPDTGDTEDEATTGSFLKRKIDTPLARARVEATGEQRSAWAYLGLLTVLFAILVIVGFVFSDARPDEVTATDAAAELVGGATPSQLVYSVDGDVVAVQGAVPDAAARDQLIATAENIYGAGNVVDEISIDDGTTLESGTVRFVGSSILGDERPEALQESVAATFGLANRGFEVGFAETIRGPVDLVATVDGNGAAARVTLAGTVPDEQSATDLQAAAAEIWGAGNVDTAGLVVGDATWTDGVVRLSGSTVPTDDRPTRFGDLVRERIDSLVTVDTSGLSIVDNSAQIAEVQISVEGLVTASPIQFAPDSPEIDASSDAVLSDIAESLNRVPDVPFEVVGHTDDVGEEQDNLLLSEQRAEAVVDRLAELGVDPGRMTARGEGEANPIADNDTDDGKAANRRIEFILVGTSNG